MYTWVVYGCNVATFMLRRKKKHFFFSLSISALTFISSCLFGEYMLGCRYRRCSCCCCCWCLYWCRCTLFRLYNNISVVSNIFVCVFFISIIFRWIHRWLCCYCYLWNVALFTLVLFLPYSLWLLPYLSWFCRICVLVFFREFFFTLSFSYFLLESI